MIINQIRKVLLPFLLTLLCVIGIAAVNAQSIINIDQNLVKKQLQEARILQNKGRYLQARKILTDLYNNLQTQPVSTEKLEVLRELGNTLRLVGDFGNIKILNDDCTVKTNDQINAINILGISLNDAIEVNDKSAQMWSYFYLANTASAIADKYQSLVDNDTEIKNLIKDANGKTLKCYDLALTFVNDNQLQQKTSINVAIELNKISFLLSTKLSLMSNSYTFFSSTEENIDSIIITKVIDNWANITEEINKLPTNRTKINAQIELAANWLKLSAIKQRDKNTSFNIPISDNIINNLNSSLKDVEKLKDTKLQSYITGYLGAIYEQEKRTQYAIDLTKEALKLAANNQYISYRWQWQLGRLYKEQNKIDKAIAYYTKAYNDLQKSRENLVFISRDIQYSFREEVKPVYTNLIDLSLQNKDFKLAIKVIKSLQIAELDNLFRLNCLKQQNKEKVKLEETEQYKSAAIIYTIFINEQLNVIVDLPNQNQRDFEYHQLKLEKNEKFIDVVSDLYDNLKNNQNIEESAQKLYDWLIPQNVYKKLTEKSIKTLIFVSDPLLQNIPMSVLLNQQNKKYLIEEFKIVVNQGLPIFKTSSQLTQNSSALIAGIFNEDALSLNGKPPLSNVESELTDIVKILKKKPLLLENKEFEKKNILNKLSNSDFSIVHFATHGQFSSDEEKTNIDAWDESLNLKDLQTLIKTNQLQSKGIKLLVLSACETSIGDQRAALGLAGIAISSGAESTLATLWKVNDKSTSIFMPKFYHYLLEEKQTKAQALQSVQKDFLKEKEYDNPYYWAAFVLLGNGD